MRNEGTLIQYLVIHFQHVLRFSGFFRELINPNLTPTTRLSNSFTFYDVPFGVMVPRNESQAKHLLVPVCISASSVAYSSTRIENMFMDLGSAAGVAVAGLLDQYRRDESSLPPVQRVNITQVQQILSAKYNQRFHGIGVETESQNVSVYA